MWNRRTAAQGQALKLLSLSITPADRERGRARMIEDALRLIRQAYDSWSANNDAVVEIDVTVRNENITSRD